MRSKWENMGVPGGGLPRAWAAALCLSLAAGDLPTLATTPELPFQKFPVLPPQCRNNIYAEPVDPADVVPGGHRRLCGPARGTSWNGKVDLTVLGGAFVGPGARTLQLVTAQLERGAPPRFFNYARAVGAAKSLKCAWPDGTTTPASVFMQAQDMVAVHQCAAPPAARTARTVRLWGRGQDLTLDLCDHDEEYPRVYDVTFCAGPVFGDPNAAHVVEWFELNRRHWASARAALYLRLEPGPRERLARALAWYVAHGLVELVDWAPVAPVARGDVDDDQWDHRDYLCANQIFNPTSMCAYSNVLTRALPPCFENSLRAIDSSKNQPNRLRCDRAREFQSLVGTSQLTG